MEWFSIVLGLGLMLLLSFTGLYLIEYILPYARSVQGIERASQAYFESYSGIEDSLYAIHTWELWVDSIRTAILPSDYTYTVSANGRILPPFGEGNSEFDANRNTFSKESPIQLLVWKGRLSSGTERITMNIRVPNFDEDITTIETLDISDDDEMILWQLSSPNTTLYTRSGSLIQESDINASRDINLWSYPWVLWNGTNENFRDFYRRECDDNSPWSTQECVLKISLIRDIIASGETVLPFLEYKIETSQLIPTRLTRVVSEGKTFGFRKTLKLSVPQRTTNAAFDFTVFQ